MLGRSGSPTGALSESEMIELGETLLSRRGEATGVALAQTLLAGYAAASQTERLAFLKALADLFGPDQKLVEQAMVALTDRAGVASLSLRLGNAVAGPDGAPYAAALYPLPHWKPRPCCRVRPYTSPAPPPRSTAEKPRRRWLICWLDCVSGWTCTDLNRRAWPMCSNVPPGRCSNWNSPPWLHHLPPMPGVCPDRPVAPPISCCS